MFFGPNCWILSTNTQGHIQLLNLSTNIERHILSKIKFMINSGVEIFFLLSLLIDFTKITQEQAVMSVSVNLKQAVRGLTIRYKKINRIVSPIPHISVTLCVNLWYFFICAIMCFRPLTGIEISESLLDMLMTKPVREWRDHINGMSMPDYYITIGAIFANSATLLFPDFIVDAIFPLLMDLFSLNTDVRTFLWDKYVPEVLSNKILIKFL
jgi:hypothetical protein